MMVRLNTSPISKLCTDIALYLAHGVYNFKLFSLLLQEMTFEMDEDFLYCLLEFTQFSSTQQSQTITYVSHPYDTILPANDTLLTGMQHYFKRRYKNQNASRCLHCTTFKNSVSSQCDSICPLCEQSILMLRRQGKVH